MNKVSLSCGCCVRFTDVGKEPVASWAFCSLHANAHRLLGVVEDYLNVTRSEYNRRRCERIIADCDPSHNPHSPIIATATSEKEATAAEELAIAVLRGDDTVLVPLVDELMMKGRLPMSVGPNAEALKYRKALEDCVDSCRRWSAGMDNIYEFIEARKLLGELVEEEEETTNEPNSR